MHTDRKRMHTYACRHCEESLTRSVKDDEAIPRRLLRSPMGNKGSLAMTKGRSVLAMTKVLVILCALMLMPSMGSLIKADPDDEKMWSLYELGQIDDELADIKVTLNYSNANLSDVLRSLSADTHINIVAGKDIFGNVTVHLADVSLESALHSILASNGYTYVNEGNILRVIPIAEVKPSVLPDMATEVFTLKYANAQDVKTAIEKLISKDGLIQVFSRSSAASNKARPNIILVKDYPEVLKNIADIIKAIDKELPQVLIETRFLNVQLDDTDKTGIDWVIKATLTGSKIPTTFPFDNEKEGVISKGSLIPGASTTSTDFSLNKLFPFAVKGDFTFGSLTFAETTAVLEMLEKKEKVTVISSPRVAVVDGEEALINIGENVPIPLYDRSVETGIQYISGYQDQKIGIILRATPHLVGGNKILINLHPEVSEISRFVGPNSERPVTTTKEVSTSVLIPNGDTIIIGGLMKKQETTIDHRVPFLGSVPVLGAPFRFKSKVMSKTELLIFVTPHIINKERFEEIESYLTKEERKKGIASPLRGSQ